MKKYVDKDKLQEFTTKLTGKYKQMFSSPLVASTVADMTDEEKVYVYVGSETGYTNGNWYYYDGSDWVSGGVYNAVAVETDDTLLVQGQAADSKAVGDAINEVKEDLAEFKYGGGGLTDEARNLLLYTLEKVAWIDDNGTEYLEALESALFPVATLESITAVFTSPSINIYDDWDLDDLKQYLTVTAHYDDESTQEVSSSLYELSGELSVGTSTITVTYARKTTTFDVTVSAPLYSFEIGVHNFTSPAGKVEATNANTAIITSSTANSNDTHANLSKVSANTSACNSNNNYNNGGEKFFTIPANSTCRFKAYVNAKSNWGTNTGCTVSVRGASQAVIKQMSVSTVGEWKEISPFDISSATDVYCIGSWLGTRGGSVATMINMSVVLYVGDVRYI